MSFTENTLLRKGTNEFTPYGEFISYYHTHLKIFDVLIGKLNLGENEKLRLKKQIRDFLKENIKNTDDFMENLPKFAQILKINSARLSEFMNNNFIKVLNKVQIKLKEQEEESIIHENSKAKTLTEDILKLLGNRITVQNYKFEKSFRRFMQLVNVNDPNDVIHDVFFEPVIEKIEEESASNELENSGHSFLPVSELRENQWQNDDLDLETIFKESKKQDINSKELLTSQIIQLLNGKLKGEKLDLLESKIDWGELTEEEIEKGISIEKNLNLTAPRFEDKKLTFEKSLILFSEYMNLVQNIRKHKRVNNQTEYRNWMASLSLFLKSVISIQDNLIKEMTGSMIDWERILTDISKKSSKPYSELIKLRRNLNDYIYIRQILEKSLFQVPDYKEELKDIWQDFIYMFDFYPDVDRIEPEFKNFLAKYPIKNQSLREEIQSILRDIKSFKV